MKYLDATLPAPAENLACDEALLGLAEETGAATLRFWEPQTHFVVLGYANKAAIEVSLPVCERLGIPVLRRCSGGGAVLQGPGCLNYTLALPLDFAPELATVTGANRFIMERHARCLTRLLDREVEWNGCTDLALAGRKFSGNAQRRRQRALLFHGTLLLNFDLALIERVLPMPSKQPAYRRSRSHGEFLANLGMDAGTLRQRLAECWSANEPAAPPASAAIEELLRQKYSRADWNFRS